MKFIKDPAVDQLAFDERIRWARETLDYLDRLFGLKPGDFAVDEVQIKPSNRIGSIGDYYPDERVIELPDSLLPHVGGIHPGMYKAANGRWKNVFRHELGHAFEDAFELRARKIDRKFSLDGAFERARPTTQRDLSWYSGKTRHEWFADSFSSWTHPRFETSGVRLHDELKAFLDHIIPRCHCEGECDCRDQSGNERRDTWRESYEPLRIADRRRRVTLYFEADAPPCFPEYLHPREAVRKRGAGRFVRKIA